MAVRASLAADVPRLSAFSAWSMGLVAGIFALLAGVNLVAQLDYELHGARTGGVVVEFHASSSRSSTVDAVVHVAPAQGRAFDWPVEDTFGLHDWHVGEAVPLLCAHIHADHLSCVLDSYADRYLFPVTLLAFGGGLAALCGWSRLRRAPPSAAPAA